MFHKKISLCYTVLLSSIVLFLPLSLFAAAPVKSVDEAGNVTYSDKAVPGSTSVTKVPLIPGPNESEITAAQQQADKNINSAKKINKKNKAVAEKEKKAKKSQQNKSQEAPVDEQQGINNGQYYGIAPKRRPIHRPPNQRPPTQRPPVQLPSSGIGRR